MSARIWSLMSVSGLTYARVFGLKSSWMPEEHRALLGARASAGAARAICDELRVIHPTVRAAMVASVWDTCSLKGHA
eukprot:6947895-Prymnesium_polylepis.1